VTVTDEPRLVEFPALKEAQGLLDAKRKELADVLTEAGADYDMGKVKSLDGDTHAKVAWIGEKNAEIDEAKSKVDQLLVVARAAGAAKEAEEHAEAGSEPGSDTQTKDSHRSTKTFGEQFLDSPAFKEYRPGSGIGPQTTLDVDVNSFLKADFLTSAGWAPETTRTGRVEMFPTRPAPHVVEFLPQTTTTQASVVYMEETTFTNTAAERAEATAYPEASLVLTERSSPVRKFEDEPRAQAYVNNRLPFMLRQRVDSQVLVGTGVAPNLLGTENVVGIQTQALGADPVPDAVYKAMRKVRDNGFAEPSVVFVTPAQWEPVRLLRTADGVYIWGHPSMPGPMTIWGVPVVETTAAPATKALLGDYANFSELAARRGIDVQVSNSHSDFFINGKLAVRADVRLALIHYRPKAFAQVTGLP
jgi:hypothetical protein